MFLLSRMDYSQRLKARYNQLPESDKRIVKMYLQMSLDDINTRKVQYINMVNRQKINDRKKNISDQVFLYELAYQLKDMGVKVGGKRKTRKERKGKVATRKRKNRQ